jgi:murein DD-endopeptidase MepM/ murein hydrolase activator NlpD
VPALPSFPLLAAPGWRAESVDLKRSGAQCSNSAGRDPRTYRQYTTHHPIERPILYDSFDAQRGEHYHHATDITCPRGVPVVSTTDGQVVEEWVYRGERRPGAGESANGGKYAYIRDPAGNKHYYAHMDRLMVRSGQQVRAGQQIGTCGDTGNARGGCPHLHYGIRDPSGRAINPFPLLREGYEAGGWLGRPRGGGVDLTVVIPVVGAVALLAAAGFAFWAWRRAR